MIVCFDIGGTAIRAAAAQDRDSIAALGRMATPAHDFDAFVAALAGFVAAAGGRVRRVALSIAGVTDPETGRLTCANIPCIDGRPLAADLGERLGIPVIVANDADCFAVAEAGLGAGRGHRIVFGIILGTGVGGGLVVDGRLVNSDGGFAGEWGHGPAVAASAGTPPVEIPSLACPCGQSRCVDTLGGARGMERLHRMLHAADLSSEAIVSAWQAGDARATRIIDILVDLLASPLALAVNITGASIVPVGGGLSHAAPLIAALDACVRARILRRLERPLVVPGTCQAAAAGLEPGLIGAALMALDAA
ncbi:ROK family protein [Ensifer soli]|uniref:ROK family protein n=1 Tax=Ciceribacter sp. sgz301302 TaxID=3342379 RepID=UPI0035BA5E76